MTQTYKETGHIAHNKGNPKDYPIDDNGGDSKKNSYFYCPCAEMIVKRIYGVGTTSGNTLWLESTSQVVTPTFTDFVTIKITHPNDDQFKNIFIGKKYQRGEKIVLEGDDGKATGYHLHISVGRGQMVGSGWSKNSTGAWVIKTTKGGVKPENAFYIDKNFTTIKNTKGLKFISLDENASLNTLPIKYVTTSLNVRYGPSTTFKIRNSLPAGTKVNILEEKGTWSRISSDEWLSSNYLTTAQPSIIYETKQTTADFLNVRKTPNGTILKVKAPLPKNTTVAVMETKNNWTKINADRWVYSPYLI